MPGNLAEMGVIRATKWGNAWYKMAQWYSTVISVVMDDVTRPYHLPHPGRYGSVNANGDSFICHRKWPESTLTAIVIRSWRHPHVILVTSSSRAHIIPASPESAALHSNFPLLSLLPVGCHLLPGRHQSRGRDNIGVRVTGSRIALRRRSHQEATASAAVLWRHHTGDRNHLLRYRRRRYDHVTSISDRAGAPTSLNRKWRTRPTEWGEAISVKRLTRDVTSVHITDWLESDS